METRNWLLGKLRQKTVRGLVWTDEKRKEFRMPAKHLGRHDRNRSDEAVYKVRD